MRILPAGRRAALLEFDADDAAEPSMFAAAMHSRAGELRVELTDVVPGARTVLVVTRTPEDLEQLLAKLPDPTGISSAAPDPADELHIEVRYDGADLESVAALTSLTVEQVIGRHVAGRYRAAFVGFAPGFVYLTGLDPVLQLPRLDTPRAAVPAGSLAIADAYTAIYPRRSPGGWHLIGTAEVAVFDPQRDPAALISPGQAVRFVRARR